MHCERFYGRKWFINAIVILSGSNAKFLAEKWIKIEWFRWNLPLQLAEKWMIFWKISIMICASNDWQYVLSIMIENSPFFFFLYLSNALDQRRNIRLIGEEVWLHAWPMVRIPTFQCDATTAVRPQENRHHTEGWLKFRNIYSVLHMNIQNVSHSIPDRACLYTLSDRIAQ